MTITQVFLRDAPASASGFPVPRADCCCSTPYHHTLSLLVAVRGALFPDIDVNHHTADALTIQSSAISGAAAEVKYP